MNKLMIICMKNKCIRLHFLKTAKLQPRIYENTYVTPCPTESPSTASVEKSGVLLANFPLRTSVDLKIFPAVKVFFLTVIQCPRLQKVNPRCDFFTYPSPHELLGGSKNGPSNNGVTQHYVLAGKL